MLGRWIFFICQSPWPMSRKVNFKPCSVVYKYVKFSLIILHSPPPSANPLPAGIITADGQQQNVMVYTTSYQQVQYPAASPVLLY